MFTHIVRSLIPLLFAPACAGDQRIAADASHPPEDPFTLTVRLAHQILSVQFPIEAPKTAARRQARAASKASSCARKRRRGVQLISLDGLTVLYPTRAVDAIQDFTTPCVPREHPAELPWSWVAEEPIIPLPVLRLPAPSNLSEHLRWRVETDIPSRRPFRLRITPDPRPIFEPDASVWELHLDL